MTIFVQSRIIMKKFILKTAADVYIKEHAEDSIYSAYYYGDYEYQ